MLYDKMTVDLSSTEPWIARYKFDGTESPAQKIRIIGKLLNQLIAHGKRDRNVRKATLQVLEAYNVPEKDWIGEITAVKDWIRNNIRYTLDIQGVETFHTPRRILLDRVGDCDDSSILCAAMLGSIGYRTGILLLDSKGDGKISHAMATVKLPRPKEPWWDKWIPLELTQEKKIGWLPPKATRKIIVENK